MKKQIVLCLVVMLAFGMFSFVFAEDDSGTIVSPELTQSYIDQQDSNDQPQAVKDLLDQGTITVVRDANLANQNSTSGK